MRKGLTPSINNIIDAVSTLDAIKSYVLCGGTSPYASDAVLRTG